MELLSITVMSEDTTLKGALPSIFFTQSGRFIKRFDLPALALTSKCVFSYLNLDVLGCDGALPDDTCATLVISDEPEMQGDTVITLTLLGGAPNEVESDIELK